MAGPNFGILQAIPAPQVVGSVPANNSPSPVDSLAGGFMQGFGEMSRIQNENARTKIMQQQTDQNERTLKMQEEMHPLDMQEKKQKNQMTQMQLDVMQEQFNNAKTADERMLASVGPQVAAQIQMQRATAQKTLNDVTKGNAENNYAVIDHIAAAAMNAATYYQQTGGKDPKTTQAIYLTGLNTMPDEMKPIADKMLKSGPIDCTQWSPQCALVWGQLGEEAKMRWGLSMTGQIPNTGKDDTPNQAKVDTWHKNRIAELKNEIADAKKNGQDTTALEQELKDHEEGASTNRTGTTTKIDKTDPSTVGRELDVADIKKSQEDATNSDSAIENLSIMKKLNSQFKTGLFAETGLNIGKAYQTLTNRELKSTPYGEAILTKGMDFVLERIQKTKGAISDLENENFAKASPGMRNSQAGNDLIIDIAMKVEQRKQEKYQQQRDYYDQHGSLKGFNDQWKSYIEKNPIITPEMLAPFTQGKGGSNSQSQSNNVQNPRATINGKNYEKRPDGQWYPI